MLTFTLKKKLRDFTVDISQEIKTETLVLIGHSGCGKSTTLQMLAGLMHPDEGKIELDEHLLGDTKNKVNVPPEKRNIGYVFQNYALFPHLSVRKNIAFGIRHLQASEIDKRVEETMAFLGIEALAESKPAQLSGGEQQRVALARALVTQPKLLLLDEPLSALDVSTRSFVRMELKELLKELSIPTIIVTHDYEDARVLADRVAVMDRGTIIQSGTPRNIAKYPANHFVAEFTSTNLVAVEKGDPEHPSFVAFDPWRVELSRGPTETLYQWNGEIRDMSWLGGFVRLHIDGMSPFFADIPIEQYEQENYQIGETVFATVHSDEVRTITPSIKPSFAQKEKVSKTKELKLGNKNRKAKWVYPLFVLLLLSFVATAYGTTTKTVSTPKKVEMFSLIAANATDPFTDFIKEFESEHKDVNVEATFAGTQIVRTQLEQGAEADLFLSADLEHIEAVRTQGLIDDFFPVSKNHVVIVIPKVDKIGIESLEDLASKKVKLVIGTDTVPIGKYTREIFEKANSIYGEDFSERVMINVVSYETNVKQVLQKVSLGEAEAGLVYVTDVTPDFLEKVDIITIPKEYNVVATNYISVPVNAPNKQLAQEFMQLMLSEKGQEIFLKYKYDRIE